ncbi:MAG: sigma-70 family RNA polymerase sigma factor [Chitinophagaceae bacterium]
MYKDHETPRFWISYCDALRSYVERQIADKNVVDDILHEVYLKIFCYCRRYDFCCEKAGVKDLRSWVFRVCHNSIIDYQKKNARYKYNIEIKDSWAPDLPESRDESPLCLEELIKLLPPKYAEAIWYDSVLLLKQAEIAQKLGLSLSAAKSRIQRGKKLFRSIYMQQLSK